MVNKMHEDVAKFHEKFDLLRHTKPGRLTKRKLQERIEFMQEELNEFKAAAGLNFVPAQVGTFGGPEIWINKGPQDLVQQADALVDLVYVALGTAVMMGLPWQALWDDVQRANMAKVRGATHRGHAVDVKKPKDWIPPQGDKILHEAGYDPNGVERDDV